MTRESNLCVQLYANYYCYSDCLSFLAVKTYLGLWFSEIGRKFKLSREELVRADCKKLVVYLFKKYV